MHRGRCLCGSVRYEVDGPIDPVVHCHCRMCRKHHGVPFVTWAVAAATGYRVTAGADHVVRYASSPGVHRAFCDTCGSVLPELTPGGGNVVVPAGNLDGDLPDPQLHMFVRSKAGWHTIADDLPRHDDWPAAYGMQPVAWEPPAVSGEDTSGSCLCGHVAYAVTGAPLRFMYCHCSRCRLARGAAHAANLFYAADGFRWLRGADDVVDYALPEARYFAVAFCRRCGSTLPRVSTERGVVVLPAGSLDTEPGLRAQAHIHVGSRAAWDRIGADGLPQFDTVPPPAG
jgi:hypothetical protein